MRALGGCAAHAKQPSNRAIVVIADVAFDPDPARVIRVLHLVAQPRRVELFAVLFTRDVSDLGLVVKRHELTDQEQHHRACGGERWSARHGGTIA
jgi:hypothetical protein